MSSLEHRRIRHETVATHLSRLADDQLVDLLDSHQHQGTDTGGTAWHLTVEDIPVFAKRIRLTELEQRHPHSTANLFDMPAYCHYRLGSSGLGAWRELATHLHTTELVLTGQYPGFPLTHHWRILPAPVRNDPDAVTEAVAVWGDLPGVRNRFEAIEAADTGLVVFTEHFPHVVRPWLATLEAAQLPDAYRMLEAGIIEAAEILRRTGFIHFDVHFDNILTDGRQTYLTDYGLAQSTSFELTEDEHAFHTAHRDYDLHGGINTLINTLFRQFGDTDPHTTVGKVAAGEMPSPLPAWTQPLLDRHIETAAAINRFHRRLQTESLTTPYPAL
ncbi:hypothetical protein FB566_0027 [Stackebrandtia endophytica]|uniref:Protein kinase domain-containing protein n=1 Tax=Stackebrandtia endophytica TaxID=1496996 RepID=A0A543APP2_9ACTN|nr:protein kinase family protein [Stackebrandtia endophytica]TQL74543.1 hypothetical protein FB566_0027 [Stackebrandtia endophytica]